MNNTVTWVFLADAKKAFSAAGALINKNRAMAAGFEKGGLGALGLAKNTNYELVTTDNLVV